MEFNPLDLLAKAAELQQKHHDDPDITMVTRRRNISATSKLSSENLQKENTEIVNNNNNNIKSKGIPMTKKVNISSNKDLEKMLNEHNYGNAKRSQCFDKNVESGFEVSEGYRANTALSGSSSCITETKPSHIITTFGKNGDKVSVITKSSSQVNDSECKCGKKLSVKSPGKGSDSYSSCKCGANSGDKSSEQLVCLVCVPAECDCLRPSGEHSQVGSDCSDKPGGHLPDSFSVIQDSNHIDSSHTKDGPRSVSCSEKHVIDKITCSPNLCNTSGSHKKASAENCMKINVGIENEKSHSCTSKQNEVISSVKGKDLVDIDLAVDKPSNMVECSEFNTDMVSKLDFKATTSDRKKLPYVKVIPSQSKSNTTVDMPQTSVINISNKTLATSSLVQSASEQSPSLLEMDMLKSQQCEKSDKYTSGSTETRTLLATQTDSSQLQVTGDTTQRGSPVKEKLDSSTCDKIDLAEKSESYDSLKRLELSDSLCSDISSTSVHLLSPDRRNPDSMGIAESPITAPLQDSSGLSEAEGDCDKCVPDLNCPLTVSQTEVSGSDCCTLADGATKCTNQGLVFDQNCHSVNSKDSQQDSSCLDNSVKVKELVKDSRLMSDSEEKLYLSDNSAIDQSTEGGNDVPIFRFESDHCYAGLPRETNCSVSSSVETEEHSCSEGEEVKTPMDSVGETSQDSGYEDVTQSPDIDAKAPGPTTSQGAKTVKSLVPVLISVNNTGCLTLHRDPCISQHMGQPVLTVADGATLDNGGLKLLPGASLSTLPQSPLILSPVISSTPTIEPPPLVQTNAENILGLLRPTSPDVTLNTPQEKVSPPKFGKFRIGTYASFSNSGIGMENPKGNQSAALPSQVKNKAPSPPVARVPRANGVKSTPTVVDTLGSLVQKVKSSLSPAMQIDNKLNDHIQHDHDYCLKSLVPSLVSSVLEAKLQKEAAVKGKVPYGKLKKAETELARQDSRTGKRKRSASSQDLSEDGDFEEDSECYSQPEFVRPKTRAEKYIEQKSAEPKVKITGSSTFQDQFVYFMNTKKRSRRRESRDSPLPISGDRVFIPPKPGDIVVPHLSDQDIENLKKRSKLKQSSGHGFNSLRNEFMAAKLSNTPFNSSAQHAETAVDEKNIINTILSLENENLGSPEEDYNESMELYGQGLGSDMMNFLPEQMNLNLTQEQMDLLYSAVDEVQNSSPGLVGAEKLVSSTEDQTGYSAFPMPDSYDRTNSQASGDHTLVKPTTGDSQLDTSLTKPDHKTSETANTEGSLCKTESTDSATDSPDSASAAHSTASPSEANLPARPEFVAADCKEPAIKVENTGQPLPSGDQSQTPLLAPPLTTTQTQGSALSIDSCPSSLAPFIPAPAGESGDSSMKTAVSVPPVNITNSLNTEMGLPALDKSSLDLLGNDFRLDKTDLFTDSAVAAPAPTQMDTSAPWIVTVSMYWNDLPAIMINNQPYVRLVDIHKQILPAKDTGILKKRCQLMGIQVENCTEMQRYFLVQYGKAFNSKSTLIVSKDSAKDLIGYYVDPQPKTARIEDHKSIIDHRREQLRRIALARRAAIRARKLPGRKEEDDPRAITERDILPGQERMKPQSSLEAHLVGSVVEPVTAGIQPVLANPPPRPAHLPTQVQGTGAPKRATRHKKINFLEMLRGDTANPSTEDDGNTGHDETNKKTETSESRSSAKRAKVLKNKKMKLVNVKYSILSESSEETESNYTESELSSTESTSESEMVVKNHNKHKFHLSDIKTKSGKYGMVKKHNRVPLKVKITSGKNKLPTCSTPVTVQVVNKAASPALPFPRNRFSSVASRDGGSTAGGDQLYNKAVFYRNQAVEIGERKENGLDNIQSYYTDIESDPYSKQVNIPEFKKVIVEQINEADVKIPTTLPDEILEEESKTREMETNTDFDVTGTESNEEKSIEVSEETDNGDDLSLADSDVAYSLKKRKLESLPGESTEDSSLGSPFLRSDRNISSESLDLDAIEERSRLTTVTNRPLLMMKGQGNSTETPLRIVHREASPLSTNRSRSQLGELFIERYAMKKSPCIRCYTCRKMMSVDNFMRHMHDIANGGLLSVNMPRTIDFCEDLSDSEKKVWEAFQRKKELFDNNQLPSPDIVQERIYGIDSDSNQSLPENISDEVKASGPRIINTPVSPVKTVKPHSFSRRNPPQLTVDTADGVRSSGRKRKKKQLYPFEEYTFAKFPRLHGQNTADSLQNNAQ